MIRTLWLGLNLFVGTILIAGMVVISALLRLRTRIYDWAARRWSQWMLWASATPLHVEGLEHVRAGAPQIFVSNHQSWYDVWALAVAIPKRYRFIAKKELARIPIFGHAWIAAGHISVDRSNRAAAIESLQRAGRLVREDNSSVVIYPEGTRSPTGRMLPFKKGAFMLALHTGIEIVPVAVSGTRAILAKGEWRVRPGPIHVRFGEPVRPQDYGMERREQLIRTVRDRIAAMRTDAPEDDGRASKDDPNAPGSTTRGDDPSRDPSEHGTADDPDARHPEPRIP